MVEGTGSKNFESDSDTEWLFPEKDKGDAVEDSVRWSAVWLLIIIIVIIPSRAAIPDGCDAFLDITFIMDESESILENDPPETPYYNWNLFKNFVQTVVQGLPVGTDTRTALIKYSTEPRLMWNLDTHSDSHGLQVLEAVQGLEHAGGNTNTAAALRMARQAVYGNPSVLRPASAAAAAPAGGGQVRTPRRVIVLMTDGLSTVQAEETTSEALETRADNIEIYVIAIGKYIDESEIRAIATEIDTHIIHVTDFGRLRFIHDVLIHRLCNLPDPAPPTDTAPDCDVKMDLAFVVDNSGSIRDKNRENRIDNYVLLKKFVQTLVDQLDVGQENTRIAAVRFSDNANIEFNLTRYYNKEEMKSAISKMSYRGSHTNTAAGLRLAVNEIFQPQYGDRPDVRNVILLITDGESTREQNLTIPEAYRAKQKGIQIYVVGVTDEINENELRAIASDPDEEHYFDSGEIKYLNTILFNLVKHVCSGRNSRTIGR